MDKVIGVVLGLAIVAALFYGWVWVLTLALNYVLASFGLKQVGMMLVFVCMFLLGVLSSYFRTKTVKVQS
jgi:hypothetical protein